MHRKNHGIPFIPVGQILGVLTLASLLVSIVLMLFSVTTQPASASVRPYWDGKGTWTRTVEPMCTWRDVYHVGLIRTSDNETYWAECLPEGPGSQGPYSWSLVGL